MPPNLDFLIVPLHRENGQDRPNLPGLHLANPPRRAARARKKDRLLLLLNLGEGHALRPDQQLKLLEDMAEGFFTSKGSVTAALREQAERLNLYLLSQNQRQGRAERSSAALLTMLALNEQRAILAQCGPVHAFLLSGGEIRHFFDPQNAGRGLGLGQTTDIRFFQSELEETDLFLAMNKLPSGWNQKTFSDVQGQKLATLRRRFLGQAGTELRAVLLSAAAGSGELKLLASGQEPESQESQAGQALGMESHPPVAGPETLAPSRRARQGVARSWEAIEVPQEEAPAESQKAYLPAPELAMEANTEVEDIGQPARIEWLEGARSRLGAMAQRSLPALRTLLLRMLPEETSLSLPPRTMALIAALVPVGVVVLVSVIYLQVGRGQLYDSNMAQAQSAAAAAEARQDPQEAREAWEATLYYAQRAVGYEATDEASALRQRAQVALDEMDAILRLDFQPALFNALPQDVRIMRMLATNTDLYLLNASDGSVLRAFLTGGGYQLDEDFRCGPGPYGGYIVSALVDIALLPRGNPQGAALVALDGDGNLIYCIVGERPLARPLEPPDSNWGQPVAIEVENENLYVLDPLTNAVWLYFGEEFAFADEPRFFFGADVPSLHNVIDLAVQGEDLYLLNLEGQMAVCRFRDDIENPTTCEDPVEYSDGRPGRQNGANIEGALFLGLQTTDPPEPSIFMLDPIAPAVYQFSLRLSLVRQYRAASSLPEGVASAFAVSPNRAIFLAFDNQLYIGFLP